MLEIVMVFLFITSCHPKEDLVMTPSKWYFDSLKWEVLSNGKIEAYNEFANYRLYRCFLCELRMADNYKHPDAYYQIAWELLYTCSDKQEITKNNLNSLTPFVRDQVLYFFSKALILKQATALCIYSEDADVKKIVNDYMILNNLTIPNDEKECKKNN